MRGDKGLALKHPEHLQFQAASNTFSDLSNPKSVKLFDPAIFLKDEVLQWLRLSDKWQHQAKAVSNPEKLQRGCRL